MIRFCLNHTVPGGADAHLHVRKQISSHYRMFPHNFFRRTRFFASAYFTARGKPANYAVPSALHIPYPHMRNPPHASCVPCAVRTPGVYRITLCGQCPPLVFTMRNDFTDSRIILHGSCIAVMRGGFVARKPVPYYYTERFCGPPTNTAQFVPFPVAPAQPESLRAHPASPAQCKKC